jgi:hypothetical protein
VAEIVTTPFKIIDSNWSTKTVHAPDRVGHAISLSDNKNGVWQGTVGMDGFALLVRQELLPLPTLPEAWYNVVPNRRD